MSRRRKSSRKSHPSKRAYARTSSSGKAKNRYYVGGQQY